MSSKFRKKITKDQSSKLIQYQNYLQNELNMTKTFCEYFLIIGIDPKISMRTYLYNTEPNELLKFYDNEIKPEILTKFPPMKKDSINIDNTIIDLCFQDGFGLKEFSTEPKKEIFNFLLDNYFYSIDHPHKYITCLKFYESLEKYHQLKDLIQKIMGITFDGKIPKYDGGQSTVSNFLNLDEQIKEGLNLSNASNKSDEPLDDILLKKMKNKIKNYYFPKVICLISLEPFYKEQGLILNQIYNYSNNNSIKRNAPLEKIVLNILCNIPMPTNGVFDISYKFVYKDINDVTKNDEEIKIKRHKYNELDNIDSYLIYMSKFYKADELIEIFKYTLYEIKTVIFSSNINNPCIFINGLLKILFPFKYSFQVSSCVPNNSYEVLESISPYILGINKKYDESFFINNEISTNNDLIILDLDSKKIIKKIDKNENYPDLPKSYYKKLKSGIEDCIKKFNKANRDDLNLFSSIFFDFFLNILYDYSNYLNNDYFFNKSKYKNSSIGGLFKIKDFVNSHYSNERAFIERFVKSQMFSDFIFKKMLPKNINDKMDILFFDENLNKKYNDKILLFGKKKVLFFLNSKEYQYSSSHNVPRIKGLSQEEKNRYDNKEYILKNLYLGQDIQNTSNEVNKEKEYIFNYILFPKFNNDYFFSPNYDYYFTNLINDINRINTDILSKSYLDTIESEEGEMLNYVYLAYVEMWGYSYYYQSYSEKDYRFQQLIEILDKVYHHEIEIFNLLFNSLIKFQEEEKIMKLYERLLSYKITPNSEIYSIVGKIIDKQKKKKNKEEIDKNKNYNDIEKILMSSNISSKDKLDFELQRRTFRDETEKKILGDLVCFNTSQFCPECSQLIDIEALSLDNKNIKKDALWAKCPSCNKYILPQFSVKLGNDLNLNDDEDCVKITRFVLHSPYELKVKLKETIDKDGCQFLEIDKFKMKYPSLFWSCIWYFKLYKIDFEIMLPYESNIFKYTEKNLNNFKNSNLNSKVIKSKISEGKDNLKVKKNNYKKIKKNKANLIEQNVFSFYYIKNKYYRYYHTNLIDNYLDKTTKLNLRRKTYYNLKKATKYNEYIDDEFDEIDNNKKRFTTNN